MTWVRTTFARRFLEILEGVNIMHSIIENDTVSQETPASGSHVIGYVFAALSGWVVGVICMVMM